MPQIHPTAIVEGEVNLADDVSIGPNCVLNGTDAPITVGPGTRLIGNAWLAGPLTIGERNTIYPCVTLGFSPQDLKWDPARPGAGLVIGDGNTFRESATIHRAASDETPTRIGSNNYWMACSHAGHDAKVGDNCILANGALLGGFVRFDDNVIVGGATTIHQYCHVGHGCMLSGAMGLSLDLPPWFMLTGTNVAGTINLVGLRRSGASHETIDDVRWVYRTLYRRGLSMKSALDELRTREDSPTVQEYIAFIESSKRNICPGAGKASRGTAATAAES